MRCMSHSDTARRMLTFAERVLRMFRNRPRARDPARAARHVPRGHGRRALQPRAAVPAPRRRARGVPRVPVRARRAARGG